MVLQTDLSAGEVISIRTPSDEKNLIYTHKIPPMSSTLSTYLFVCEFERFGNIIN